MQIALLNGRFIDPAQPALMLHDRGWQYGDGIFETMLLQRGRVRFWKDHVERLQFGCTRLDLQMPHLQILEQELLQLHGIEHINEQQDAVIKLTLMRSGNERGYRPPLSAQVTRLWQCFAAPAAATTGITVRWCNTRLSRNAQLAGVKHCNRLEQVLAQSEWRDVNIAEGLMLDTEGELICATMNNVFLVVEGVLVTPDLRYSGIAGVMRKNVLRLASLLEIAVELRAVRIEDINRAEEIFVCNSVRGIQAVVNLEQRHWSVGKLTQRLQQALHDELAYN